LFGGCPSQNQTPTAGGSNASTSNGSAPLAANNSLASASLADFNKLTPEAQKKLVKRMRRIEEEKDNRVLPKKGSLEKPVYPNAFPRS